MAEGDTAVNLKALTVGATFISFEEFKTSLDYLKDAEFHPFRVFNSQTGKDYAPINVLPHYPPLGQ